jgi:enamine deaminase RidA (YjgF/YER057c/UK114 family)
MVQRFDVGTRLSEMAIHNGVVYLAGQIPEDPNLDIEGQTLQVLEAIDLLMARAGTDKRKLLILLFYILVCIYTKHRYRNCRARKQYCVKSVLFVNYERALHNSSV